MVTKVFTIFDPNDGHAQTTLTIAEEFIARYLRTYLGLCRRFGNAAVTFKHAHP